MNAAWARTRPRILLHTLISQKRRRRYHERKEGTDRLVGLNKRSTLGEDGPDNIGSITGRTTSETNRHVRAVGHHKHPIDFAHRVNIFRTTFRWRISSMLDCSLLLLFVNSLLDALGLVLGHAPEEPSEDMVPR